MKFKKGMWQYLYKGLNFTKTKNLIAFLHWAYCLVPSLVAFLNLALMYWHVPFNLEEQSCIVRAMSCKTIAGRLGEPVAEDAE